MGAGVGGFEPLGERPGRNLCLGGKRCLCLHCRMAVILNINPRILTTGSGTHQDSHPTGG